MAFASDLGRQKHKDSCVHMNIAFYENKNHTTQKPASLNDTTQNSFSSMECYTMLNISNLSIKPIRYEDPPSL